jgi:hypothetical protein
MIDDAILHVLEEQQFSSIRELAKLTCIPITTVSPYLASSLWLILKHFHWVPHDLTDVQKAQGSLSQINSCASSAQSNLKMGN